MAPEKKQDHGKHKEDAKQKDAAHKEKPEAGKHASQAGEVKMRKDAPVKK